MLQDVTILVHPTPHVRTYLSTVHGAPEEALMRESKAIALKDQLVAVTITCPEASSAKEINKKLPGVAADWCMS